MMGDWMCVDQEKSGNIRDLYNKSASIYNERYAEVQREKFQICATPEELNNLIHAPILDIGCGTGLFGAFLRDLFPSDPMLIVGVDISENMIKQAQSQLTYSCIVADIESLPIRANSCQGTVSFTAFQNLVNWKKGVDSMFDVLAKGGRFMVSILKKSKGGEEFFSYLLGASQDMTPFNVARVEDFIARGKKL